MWDDRASDARRHRPSMWQHQMRARRPAQTLAPNQICTSTAELSRKHSQRSGNSDRSTADASGPEPHDYGHTVNDRSVDRRFRTRPHALSWVIPPFSVHLPHSVTCPVLGPPPCTPPCRHVSVCVSAGPTRQRHALRFFARAGGLRRNAPSHVPDTPRTPRLTHEPSGDPRYPHGES